MSKVLGNIFGRTKDHSTSLRERRTILKFWEMTGEADVVATLQSMCISWIKHV